MRTYTIMRVNDDPSNVEWDKIPSTEMDIFPWMKTFCPLSTAQLAATPTALCGRLMSDEGNLRATINTANGAVYEDSCLEFFFNPTPTASANYFNFEFNPLGTLHLGVGTGRSTSTAPRAHPQLASDYRTFFQIRSFIEAGSMLLFTDDNIERRIYDDKIWGVTFALPYAFIREYFPTFTPEKGTVMRGNFYKCGDKTVMPHYGVWNEINTPQPDYHQPEFFGELIFG